MASHVHLHAPSGLSWVRRLDSLGIWLSAICIVHCALTPLLIAVIPLFGSHVFDDVVRFGLVVVGLLGVGFGAALHKNLRAVPLLLVALVLFTSLALLGGVHAHELGVSSNVLSARGELFLSLLASFALMGAHALNTRACRDSDHTCAPGRWFADGVWAKRDGTERGFWIALAFAGGLHVAVLGLVMQ